MGLTARMLEDGSGRLMDTVGRRQNQNQRIIKYDSKEEKKEPLKLNYDRSFLLIISKSLNRRSVGHHSGTTIFL